MQNRRTKAVRESVRLLAERERLYFFFAVRAPFFSLRLWRVCLKERERETADDGRQVLLPLPLGEALVSVA